MFILVMQFLWKYIDDLMGKGLDTWIIIELLFYVSASLIPLALPLAILLSSIMVFGNLAENNELTALKSSGLSLYRIMRPLTIVVTIIALATFYFANYVIPVANFKWHSLIYDIQNTKIAAVITPGVYSKELEGYAIKVKEGKQNEFRGIVIHDHTDPTELKTIKAKRGKMYKSKNGKYIVFELQEGFISEELAIQPPNFLPNGALHRNQNSDRPARRTTFAQAVYKLDLTGFKLERSEDELFANKHEMLNVFQIYDAVDSVKKNIQQVSGNFLKSIKLDHIYFQAKEFKPAQMKHDPVEMSHTHNLPKLIQFEELTELDRLRAIQTAQAKIRRKNENLAGQLAFMKGFNREKDAYWIEFHRKFALTYAIIVLFFIGAPLGAIVRKGGFGAPVVIAALLFMIYFVLISVGDSLATSQVVSPFWGMWFASMVLTPLAFILTRAAANDSPILNFLGVISIFKSVKRLKPIRKKTS
jgi:lipopolysaccharide export system permease protein